MKKLITLAAGIMLTSSAFANTVTLNKNTSFSTETYATKAEAVNAGFDIVDNLTTLSSNELRKELNVYSNGTARHVTLGNTKVKTQEFALNRDETQYRAIVKVNYSFDTQRDDN